MKKNIFYLLILCILTIVSCKEENTLHPYGKNDKNSPLDVSDIVVRNTPGGAVIKYVPPTDVDLSYVKAVYLNTHGEQIEVRASRYVDSLIIAGLGSTDNYPVKLYSVDKLENASSGVETTIQPLTPAVWLVRESLEYEMDFGGFVVDFINTSENDIAIYVLKKDEKGSFITHDALYTKQKAGKYAVRGLPNEENAFAVYIRDRYDNKSDTLFFTGTPWMEEYLDKKKFMWMEIPGDVRWNYFGGAPERAWDDVVNNYNFAHTEIPEEHPHRFTIDLGVTAKLNRFRFWQRPGDEVLYKHGAPKYYKIYGRSDRPTDGSASDPLKGWKLLMECHSFKPSGLPLGQQTTEDIEYAARGEEFSFPRGMEAVRYIRFEMLESWSGMKCSTIGELSFWGEIQNSGN